MTSFAKRDYIGRLSLRTTDRCRKASLLSKLVPSKTRVIPESTKLENGLFLCELEGVLSQQECDEIIKQGDACMFQDMSDKYRSGIQRNNSRLLVLDEALAENLWQNIEAVLSQEMERVKIPKQPLGFNVLRGEWELFGLNEAMRINRYSYQKKEYFGPHKDAQYCPSGDKRSLLTLLVYLNEDFRGGETCFYFPKGEAQSTKSLTTQEEIDSLGGLANGFSCVKIVPKVGHAVLFTQNVLHESLPILKGTKYILKTDVVVRRHSKQFGFAVEEREREDYLTCLNYFREAQQQELLGNFHDASDLYERALSVRYCYPRCLLFAAGNAEPSHKSQNDWSFLPMEVWQNIFKYLNGHDAQNLVYAYPPLNLAKQSWECHARNAASSLSNQKFLPKVNYQKGILTRFEFPDAEYFLENVSGCCRVAAMYSFFLLGHKAEDDVYTVTYNPDTQEVCAVALETLLTDVFYNHRCYGSFYTVHQQDPRVKDPEKDFAASVDRSYMLLRHGAEFIGVDLSGRFGAKSTAYVSPEESEEFDGSEDEDDGKDDDVNDQQTEETKRIKAEEQKNQEEHGYPRDGESLKIDNRRESRNQKAEENENEKICDGFLPVYYDGKLVTNFEVDCLLTKFLKLQENDEDCPYEFPYGLFDEEFESVSDEFCENDISGKWAYYKGLKRVCALKTVSCTIVSKLKEPLEIKDNAVCVCFLGPEITATKPLAEFCTATSYNHLVFDFQRAQLSVTCRGSGNDNQFVPELLNSRQLEGISQEQNELGCVGEAAFYEVNIEPILSSDTSFNHASCNCSHPRLDVQEYCNMKDYPYLTHICLITRERHGKMLVWSLYGGIVAL